MVTLFNSPKGILGAKYIINVDFGRFESYTVYLCNFHFPYLATIFAVLLRSINLKLLKTNI